MLVNKRYSGIQDLLGHDICSEAPETWGKDGLLMAKEPEMKVAFKQLQVVLEFFYLRACFLLAVAAS